MNVKFISLKFKNILSYGNKESIFKFKDGLTSITGKNGHGKSTIIDILSYNLFGQPYRKIKIGELINRINKKGMYTESELEINGIRYSIQRGLKPGILKIFKGVDEVELLSSKKLIQDEINEILGINHNLFKQIIALAVNTNKPFLTLSAGEKRSIIETIFSIDVFGEMTKDIKKRLAELKIDLSIKTTELKGVESSYDTLVKQKQYVIDATNNFDNTKQKDLNSINKIIKDFQNTIAKCSENIDLANNELRNIVSLYKDEEGLNIEKKRLSQDISVARYKIDEITEQNKVLETDYCFSCGSILTEEHREQHKKDNDVETERCLKLIDMANKRLEAIDKITTFNEELRKKETKLKNALERTEDKESWNSSELQKAIKNKKSIQNRKLDLNAEDYSAQINEKENEKITLTGIVDGLYQEQSKKETMVEILSDTGVKSHFINKLLPILNKKVNEYFDNFEMPFVFRFNESLEEEIIAVDGNTTSYFACSEGEKKRIDISILLSFIDTIKEISNFNCNLLFFDELLDSAVDSTNLGLIVNAIKEMTIKKETLGIYVISHRSHSGIWDNIVEINKKNNFSEIKIIE